jgi:DNA repair exonuclease SbcCD ATPase subunit
VVQSTLFFILGFLCAGFLALMVAPAIWRRAVSLTRKRIEASMPLTLNEVQAETDRVRAEAAMSIRRLEISVKSLKEKAANQLIEINRSREELRRLTGETSGKTHLLADLEVKVPELQAKLREREEQVEILSKRLREADDLIDKQASELEKLGKTYEEVTFLSSARQIELAGRETEIERLSIEAARLRSQHKDMEGRVQEMALENEALEATLKGERKRLGDLEREIADAGSIDTARQSPAVPVGGKADSKLAQLLAERDRLESRLTALTRENKKLRARSVDHGGGGKSGDISLLREQIYQLAAEVVNLTATLDGPDSPIRKALSMPAASGADGDETQEKITSLADCVRALQKAASGD